MGLFGGGNSSSATTNNYVDDRDVLDYSHQSGVIGQGNTVINTVTDSGASQAARDIAISAVQSAQVSSSAAVGSMLASTTRAFDSADHFVDTTRSAYGDALGFADSSSKRAFGFASDTQSAAVGLVQRATSDAMGAASAALQTSLGALQTAKDSSTGDRKIMMVALAVVGMVGAAFALKRG